MSLHTCPACESERITVTFSGTCLLTADGSEDYGDHEYDDDSPAVCQSCGHSAPLSAFPETDGEASQ